MLWIHDAQYDSCLSLETWIQQVTEILPLCVKHTGHSPPPNAQCLINNHLCWFYNIMIPFCCAGLNRTCHPSVLHQLLDQQLPKWRTDSLGWLQKGNVNPLVTPGWSKSPARHFSTPFIVGRLCLVLFPRTWDRSTMSNLHWSKRMKFWLCEDSKGQQTSNAGWVSRKKNVLYI